MPFADSFSIPNAENPTWLGVDLSRSPDALEDGFLAWAQNTWQPELTHLALRPQTQRIINAITLPHPVLGLWAYRDSEGSPRIFLARYNSVMGYMNLEEFNSELFMNTVQGFQNHSQNRPAVVIWNSKPYIFTGADLPGYTLSLGGGNAGLNLLTASAFGTGWGSDRPRPKAVWIYRNTFVLGGFDPPEGSTVRNCNVNDPETLVAAAKSFYVGRGDGDEILAGTEVPVFGGSTYVEPYSLVFKRNSVWMLQGNLPTPGSDGSLNVTPVMRGEGLIAKETLVQTEWGPVWCSGKNVWIAPNGGTPIRLSEKLGKYLSSLSQTATHAWCASYFNGHYRLSVPSPSLCHSEYMPGWEQWWCDLREFPRVKWWGPMTIPASAMTVDNLGLPQSRWLMLYENENGIDLVQGDVETQDYVDAHGSLSGQSNPFMSIRTKEFTFGSRILHKLLLAGEASLWADRNGFFELKVIADTETTSALQTPGGTSGQVTYTRSGFIVNASGGSLIGAGVLGTTAVGAHAHQAIAAYPASGRIRGRRLQLVLNSLSSAPYLEVASLGGRFTIVGRRP